MGNTGALERLIEELRRLPGVGQKTAQRLALYLFSAEEGAVRRLAQAIVDLRDRSRYCAVCRNITEAERCQICEDPERDGARLCIVEETGDLLSIERTKSFRGVYHVLHGALSPLDGVGPEDLAIPDLLQRLQTGTFQEVILATNPNVKGEATALYLSRVMKPLGIPVTRIAHGVPVGGDLEYLDEVTIRKALEGRHAL